jgi:hypothetical protein
LEKEKPQSNRKRVGTVRSRVEGKEHETEVTLLVENVVSRELHKSEKER